MSNEEAKKNFCNNVRLIRNTCKLSKRLMAKAMGISVRTLDLLEAGTFPPCMGVGVILRLAEFCGMTPSHLFNPYLGIWGQEPEAQDAEEPTSPTF